MIRRILDGVKNIHQSNHRVLYLDSIAIPIVDGWPKVMAGNKFEANEGLKSQQLENDFIELRTLVNTLYNNMRYSQTKKPTCKDITHFLNTIGSKQQINSDKEKDSRKRVSSDNEKEYLYRFIHCHPAFWSDMKKLKFVMDTYNKWAGSSSNSKVAIESALVKMNNDKMGMTWKNRIEANLTNALMKTVYCQNKYYDNAEGFLKYSKITLGRTLEHKDKFDHMDLATIMDELSEVWPSFLPKLVKSLVHHNEYYY